MKIYLESAILSILSLRKNELVIKFISCFHIKWKFCSALSMYTRIQADACNMQQFEQNYEHALEMTLCKYFFKYNIFIRFQFENQISLVDVSRFAKCTYLTFKFSSVFGWKLFLKDFLLFLSFLFIKKFSVVRWKDSQGGNYSKLFHDSSFIPS